jgi:hypothetical protein
MVRTFLKVYMELGSYFLFLQEQTKDIIIIHKSLPLLRGVSFHVGVTGEDVLRALGLVAWGSLQVVGMALCRVLSVRDIEEIRKLLHATCPGVREVDITGCSDQVILRALSVRALSTLGASPLHVHARLMELVAGTVRCLDILWSC